MIRRMIERIVDARIGEKMELYVEAYIEDNVPDMVDTVVNDMDMESLVIEYTDVQDIADCMDTQDIADIIRSDIEVDELLDYDEIPIDTDSLSDNLWNSNEGSILRGMADYIDNEALAECFVVSDIAEEIDVTEIAECFDEDDIVQNILEVADIKDSLHDSLDELVQERYERIMTVLQNMRDELSLFVQTWEDKA